MKVIPDLNGYSGITGRKPQRGQSYSTKALALSKRDGRRAVGLLAFALVIVLLLQTLLPLGSVVAASPFTYRSETHVYYATLSGAFDAVMTKPAGAAEGDILFAHINSYDPNEIDSVPSGWQLIATYDWTVETWLYYKIAGASEPANYTWSFTTNREILITCSAFYGGFDLANPIDTYSNLDYRDANTNVRAVMTVSAADSPLIFWGVVSASSAKTFTKPTVPVDVWTEHLDWYSGYMSVTIDSMAWTGSGATGNIDAIVSATGWSKHAFAVALNPVPPPYTLDRRISASSNDITLRWYRDTEEWKGGIDLSYLGVGDMDAVQPKGYGNGLRFLDIDIPQGTKILTATLTVVANYDKSGTVCRSTIRAEDEDNATTFTDGLDAYFARTRTTEEVTWDGIGDWTTGCSYESPDLASVVQEVIDREGWTSGNALVIFWDDHDFRSDDDSDTRRLAYSYDADWVNAARLSIEYAILPTVTSTAATNITLNSATLHGNVTDIGSSNVTCRGFDWGYATGNYTVSWNETGSWTTGTFNHTLTGLTSGADVYWLAWAINSAGRSNSTELSFEVGELPGAPGNFTVEHGLVDIYVMSWDTGYKADTTIIVGNEDDYPTSPTDGYVIYSGNATTTTLQGVNADIQTCFVRAWSYNEYGYSTTYAEDMIGDSFGIIAIVFCVTMAGFALWKKGWIRILLSISLIIFGVTAMSYDIKFAAPFLAIGTILFFMATIRQISLARQGG